MPGYNPMSLYDMILGQQPNTRDPNSAFQQGMQRDPQARSWLSMPFPFAMLSGGSRGSQNNQPGDGGSQGDQNNQPSDPNSQPSYGYSPPAWMRMLGGGGGGGNQQPMNQKNAMNLGLLGLAMMQPRQQTAPRPLPWI